MVSNIGSEGGDQLVGGRHREGSPQRHQPDAGRELVDVRGFFVFQEGQVQHRHRYDAVQFQALELPCAGHPCRDESQHHRGDQVGEHGQPEGYDHHHQVLSLHAVQPRQEAPVDNFPSDHHEDAGQNCVGDRLDVGSQSEG